LTGLITMFVGPLFKPPLLANIANPGSRTVVGNLYDAFIATFNAQAVILIWFGVVLAVTPFVVHEGLKLYNKRKKK